MKYFFVFLTLNFNEPEAAYIYDLDSSEVAVIWSLFSVCGSDFKYFKFGHYAADLLIEFLEQQVDGYDIKILDHTGLFCSLDTT